MYRILKNLNHLKHISPRTVWICISAVVILAIIVAVFFLNGLLKRTGISIGHTNKIDITPTQIEKIKSIGQWEFLSIQDEELVDTVRRGFFGDAELARIYYGTLRLGIDLNEVDSQWIKINKDTVEVLLPPIKLLDEEFLDEAKTKAFYEDGKWSEKEKAQLTQKAKRIMKQRCLTPANIRSAEQNASLQFDNLLQAMGFEYTRVKFKLKETDQ